MSLSKGQSRYSKYIYTCACAKHATSALSLPEPQSLVRTNTNCSDQCIAMGGTQSTREEAVSVHLLSLSRGYATGASQLEASSTGCSSERKETIKFNSKNTHIIAFGMDANELSGAKEDATLISNTFVDVGVVPKDNKHCYIESQDENDDCTLEGMKRHLRGVCEKAVDNGLVIFFYAGHLHSSSDGKCALVQKGFQKEKEETWLTAEVFSGWLSECSGLTFAGVLCILDCCQAATMGRLSVSGQTNTYILAATSKLEFSWEVPSTKQKKNSIFSLSLKYYGINANEFKDCQGLLQLTNIYERCKECSSKLSSLHLNRPQTPVLSVARPRGTTNKPYIEWLKKA